MTNVNRIDCRGKIIKVGTNRKTGHMEITVVVILQKKKIFVPFSLSNPLDPAIRMHNMVRISGYVAGYEYKDDALDEWVRVQYFVATEVKKEKSEMEEKLGIEGHFCGDTFFRFYCIGEYGGLRRSSEDWGKFVVSVDKTSNSGKNRISVNAYCKGKGGNYLKEMEKGDTIAICTSLYVVEKVRKDGTSTKFYDLTLEDIAKVG